MGRVSSSAAERRRRRSRPVGCRICGSLGHFTKAHAGRLQRRDVHQVGPVVKERLGLDPLAIAHSSWLVGVRVPRRGKAGA